MQYVAPKHVGKHMYISTCADSVERMSGEMEIHNYFSAVVHCRNVPSLSVDQVSFKAYWRNSFGEK